MALDICGKALLIDCHSYPSEVLPYELEQDSERPEICIGTDSFHTLPELAEGLQACFEYYGFDVGLDSPFSGSLVPLQHYHRDERGRSVMIEVRRDLYMDESTAEKLAGFDRLAGIIRECLLAVSSD